MTSKKIDGYMASYLMGAVEHLARLELEMDDLRWRICYHDDTVNSNIISAQKAKTHCRKLMQELDMVIHRLAHGEDDDSVNAEQERAIRAVK